MSKSRILIIEDDPDVRAALADALAAAGAEVALAADGSDGLAQLRRGALPSVILLDLRQPRLDGDRFLRELREDTRYADVPVISMTSGGRSSGRAPVSAHVEEPFDIPDLLRIVLSLCDSPEI